MNFPFYYGGCNREFYTTNPYVMTHQPMPLNNCFECKHGGPPSNWKGARPSNGCQVFIHNIPTNLNLQQMMPILSMAGEVYEVRLIVDFVGNNKGYCYVVYSNAEEAKDACEMLNNYEVQDKRITVVMSVANRRWEQPDGWNKIDFDSLAPTCDPCQF